MKKIIFILVSFLFLASCKTVSPKDNVAQLKSRSAKRVLSKLEKNRVGTNWFSAKAKIRFESAKATEKATAYIRMKKDEKIWLSLRRLSIEGVRVLITPDSMTVMNRLGKWYASYPFERIQKAYNIPFGFEGLQEMLLGNPVFVTEKMRGRAGIEKENYILKQTKEQIAAKYKINGLRFLLQHMVFFDEKEKREVDFKQADYRPLDGDVLFSYFRKIRMQSRQTGEMDLELDFSKVVLNEEKSMRFEIPKHYEKVD